MKRINIMLTEKLIIEIDELKITSGLSRSEIIRRALTVVDDEIMKKPNMVPREFKTNIRSLCTITGENYAQRGSFVTQYIDCDKCFDKVKEILFADESLSCVKIPCWPYDKMSTIAGCIRGTAPVGIFRYIVVLKLREVLCHPLNIAIVTAFGEEFIEIAPVKLND